MTHSIEQKYAIACNRIEVLERQLRDRDALIAAMDPRLPAEFKLTRQQTRLLWSLATSPDGYRSDEELTAACRSRVALNPCRLNAVVGALRRKLGGSGVRVRRFRSAGYYLPKPSIDIIQTMIRIAKAFR